MAYIQNPTEEEKNQQLQQQQLPGAPVSGGGGTGVGQTRPPAGTGFATLQKYLSANRPQAGALAEKVVGRVGEKGQEVRGLAETAQQKLGEQLSPYSSLDASKVNIQPYGFGSMLAQSQQQAPQINPALAGKVVMQVPSLYPAGPSEEQQALSKNILSGQYSGPKSFQDVAEWNQAQTAAGKAEQLRGLLGQESGRTQLLRELSTGRPYRAGVTSLDQALLQTSPEAQQKLLGGAESLKGLQEEMAGIGKAAEERIGATKDIPAAQAKLLRDKLTGEMSGLGTYKTLAEKNIADPWGSVQSLTEKKLHPVVHQGARQPGINELAAAVKSGRVNQLLDQYKGTATGKNLDLMYNTYRTQQSEDQNRLRQIQARQDALRKLGA